MNTNMLCPSNTLHLRVVGNAIRALCMVAKNKNMCNGQCKVATCEEGYHENDLLRNVHFFASGEQLVREISVFSSEE